MSETGMSETSRRKSTRHAADHDRNLPVSDLGCLLVLTQLLTAPLHAASAIEDLRRAAQEIGWQPVSDVLRIASERCLARGHAMIDAGQRLTLTAAGRLWLLAAMTQNFADLPQAGADLLLACQLAALSQLGQQDRRGILDAVMAARPATAIPDCDPRCAASLQPWQNWTAARRAADLTYLESLAAMQNPVPARQLATATKGFDKL